MKNFRALLFILFLLSSPLFCVTRFSSITSSDHELLSLFFEELFINEPFSYTLFGDKPISFTRYQSPDPALDPASLILAQGKDFVLTHPNLFRSKNFLFKFQSNNNTHDIYFINQKAVLDIIKAHLDTFKEILGSNISPDSILSDLKGQDKSIEDMLQHHDGLLGILLGYGNKNAFLYEQKKEVLGKIRSKLLNPISLSDDSLERLNDQFFYFVYVNQNVMPVMNQRKEDSIDTLFTEFLTLKNTLSIFNPETDPLTYVPLPQFMAITDDPDTEAKKEAYTKVQSMLTHYYSHGNLVETILCKINEE